MDRVFDLTLELNSNGCNLIMLDWESGLCRTINVCDSNGNFIDSFGAEISNEIKSWVALMREEINDEIN